VYAEDMGDENLFQTLVLRSYREQINQNTQQ